MFSSKRRSFLPGVEAVSPAVDTGMVQGSPESGEEGEVVRRGKLGGLGGEVLAEMRVKQEKRASTRF